VEVHELAGRARPVSLARDHLVAALPQLAGLLPDGGLRRGSTVVVHPGVGLGAGATSLTLALMVAPSQAGSWCAAVGLPELGLVAAAGLGMCLERFALIPASGDQWPIVTAALLDAVDLVLVSPPWRPRIADARRLSARARERGAVLLALSGSWPEGADLRLSVTAATWRGLGQGQGHLRAREVEVTASGRRAATRERRIRLWLPGAGGTLEAVEDTFVGEDSDRVAPSPAPELVPLVPKAG
jgi:hypothetical protein